MTIAQTIRTLREMKNWSQEDMAAKLNISKSSYARLETGKIVRCHADEIAEKLGFAFEDELIHRDNLALNR